MFNPETGAVDLSDSLSAVPAEIKDQFSRKEFSTFSDKMLVLRGADLRERIAREPDNPVLLHELGTVSFQQGLHKEAIALWALGHKKDPNLAPSEVMAAVQEVFALLAKGKKEEAQQRLDATEKKFANQAHFQLIKGEQAMRSRNLSAAEQAYRRAHELAPSLYVTALNLARFYEYRQQDPATVERLYREAVQLAPERPVVWVNLGSFQFRQKEIRDAFDSFAQAKALVLSDPGPELRLAELNAAGGDFDGAMKWYRKALATKLAPEEELQIRAALGDTLLRLGRIQEARQEIEAVLQQKELPPMVFVLATLDEAEGKMGKAEQGYRRVLALIPENPMAANNLAMLLLRRGGATAEALKLVQQARVAVPNNAIIESTYGCALVQDGKFDQGVLVLEAVVQAKDNRDPWAHYFLAQGLLATKQPQEAGEHCKRVLAIDPDFPEKKQVLALQRQIQQKGTKR